MELFREFFKVIEQLNKAGLKYSVVGGIALAFHATPRLTKDMDILALPGDLKKYEFIFEGLGYMKGAAPITFKNTNMTLHRFIKPSESIDGEMLMVDLLLGDEDVHEAIIKRSVLDESFVGNVRVATKDDLIMMKKVRDSKQDQADIENLENSDE